MKCQGGGEPQGVDGQKLLNKNEITAFSGEEVTENYFPYYTQMPLRERRPWLSDHYKFECSCVACSNDFQVSICSS
jgi:hypothetical protein